MTRARFASWTLGVAVLSLLGGGLSPKNLKPEAASQHGCVFNLPKRQIGQQQWCLTSTQHEQFRASVRRAPESDTDSYRNERLRLRSGASAI